jgi:hydrogenase nickel incorporation protein HypA/HybF
MHELSLALSLVEIATAEASRQECKTVGVHLKLGELSGVVREALESAWSLVRIGTPLEEAELIVEEIPVAAYCPACQADRNIVSIQDFRCAACGNSVGRVTFGRELQIVALEIEA